MKKKVFILLGLFFCIFTVILIYKSKDSKLKEKTMKEEKLSIMIKGKGSSVYTKSSSKKIPIGNYTLNEEKTHCDNNGKVLSYDSDLGKVSFSFIGSDKCYLYFDYTSNVRDPKNTDVVILNNSNGATNVNDAIDYIRSNDPGFFGGTNNEPMMCATEDDLGESYYFRGAVENNYLRYGEYTQTAYLCDGYLTGMDEATSDCTAIANDADPIYWQIIRINGDGSLRLIYAGVREPESSLGSITNEKSTIGKSDYSYYSDNSEFVGYMYTLGEQHGNSENSAIKDLVDNWFINFTNLNDLEFIEDGIFCNDRNADNWVSSSGDSFLYSANDRLGDPSPSLICENKADRFTVNDTKNGNGALTYPVGLITADEAIFGGISNSMNTFSFLRTNSNYWTMTPHGYNSGDSYVNYIFGGGIVIYDGGNVYTNKDNYVRPVINISSDVNLSGDGTVGNVYYID